MRVFAAWLRVALVDLRGDLRRFGVLLACLALGVATISIVGSVGASLQAALERDARQMLGGDLEAQLSFRRANADERAVFGTVGTVAEVVEVLGNAAIEDDSVFMSLKAVDANYPLVGSVVVVDPATAGASLAELLAPVDGVYGMVASSLLVDRFGLAVGDRFTIGEADFALRGTIGTVPDQVAQTMTFGIPGIMSVEALEATDILQPGVLARYGYKMLLADDDFAAAKERILAAMPGVGWTVKSPADATADLARFFDVFARFLTIVGLSALIVGGVGVGNAVTAYLNERQRAIATLKALGATSGRILFHFLTQVLLLTLVGIGLGIVLGGIVTVLALPVVGNLLGIGLDPVVDLVSLAVAAGFGILVGMAFAFLPLKRAEALKPALLFRAAGAALENGLGWRGMLRPGLLLPLGTLAALTYALAYASTRRPELVLWYTLSVVGAFVILRLAGWLLQRVLRLLPPPRDAALRNALKAIYRPGTPAPTVILSLGLGLALLLLIALIDNNLRSQLDQESIPDAPSFVFMDLFDDEVVALEAFAAGDARIEAFNAAPILRGAIISVNGVPAEELPQPPEEFQDAFEGTELPMTASAELPEQSSVVEGEWWPADYNGEPLVSVFEGVARPMGLDVGDEITFRIFGEEVTARIANLRDFYWRRGGVNFALVLTPNVLEFFPVTSLGLIRTVPGEERAVQQALVAEFPQSVFLPVSEALDLFARVLDAVTNAIAIIGGLAVLSGLLVLAGAMAAGRRQRESDAMVMKVLGATRGDIVRAYLIEYGVLGALAALIAAALGVAGTYAFVEWVLEIDFSLNLPVVVGVVAAAIALTMAVGTATTWSALSVKPAGFLREE